VSDHHRWVEQVARRLPGSTGGIVVAAGIAFGTTGGLLGTTIVSVVTVPALLGPPTVTLGDIGIVAAVAGGAGLGAAVSGGPLWWLAVERPGEVSVVSGSLVGLSVGILMHPLTWVFAYLGVTVVELVVEGSSALADVGPQVTGFVNSVVTLTTVSLVFGSIVTVPVLAAAGGGFAHLLAVGRDLEPDRRRHA
jgi:hypothetical protein